METDHSAPAPLPKTHATLSPKVNSFLICIWALVVVSGFWIFETRIALILVITGGLLGALAGVLQHRSISQDPQGFVDASSLLGVRRAFTSTPSGRKYIAWLYFSKGALILGAFLLIKKPFYQIVSGYLVAYFSLMLVRDIITLRDTFALLSRRE